MKREIKFRVWDKDAKKMHPVGNINFDPELGVSIENYDVPTFAVTPIYQPHLVLLQYTGREDKNGKESYEGDILRDDDGDLFTIEYDDDEAGFFANSQDTSASIRDVDGEVIGNIYENPELLEETR